MPEQSYKRLDGNSVPFESGKAAANFPANSKKRKRGHHDGKSDGNQAKILKPFNGTSLTSDHQAGPSHGATSTSFLQNPGVSARDGALQPGLSSLKERARSLLSLRRALPITAFFNEIRHGLRSKDVLLLVGETGSGKSTQVPQFLIEEAWCKSTNVYISGDAPGKVTSTKRQVGGCIAITEPRRVAAITLAQRVAQEMGTPLGSSSPTSQVGYSVRFNNSTSPCTRIKYLTEGMLLQEMLRDPWLRAYSAVIVDEVHERGVNVDILLGLLRKLTGTRYEGRGGLPLKVVVMSATVEMTRLESWFEEAYTTPKEGSEPDEVPESKGTKSDDSSEWLGFSASEDEKHGDAVKVRRLAKGHNPSNGVHGARLTLAKASNNVNGSAYPGQDENGKTTHVSVCHIEGRQYPVEINYLPEPTQDIVEAARSAIFQIHYKEPMPGDILVFLTGQETVESLDLLVKEYAKQMRPDVPKLLGLQLFAKLPESAQQRVFQPTSPGTRKVIIATNVAETSLTVPGVRYVIDCGKAKTKQYLASMDMDTLLAKPISKSAAIQRKGRAGREGRGQCYRLYTEQTYLDMQKFTTPEILRSDLGHAILAIKARHMDDSNGFPFLDPPPRKALEKALILLYRLGALTNEGKITPVGQQMADLPLKVTLARTLIASSEPEFDCLSEVIDIVSCLSVGDVFLTLTSEEKMEEAKVARRELYRREGDHLTLLATVQGYVAENTDRKLWAERHFVSHRAMRAVMDVRKQLTIHFNSSANRRNGGKITHNSTASQGLEGSDRILKCFLRGFAQNTAHLQPDGGYKTFVGNQRLGIHPSSVLFGQKTKTIMYSEFVFTSHSYAKGVGAVELDWADRALDIAIPDI
ncbi:putative ATP-dependent RNA helicase dhr2 [Puttea exsequens]|nr:putative ATP-dependent RNA helicase dhr2 [Puttea exsequens]